MKGGHETLGDNVVPSHYELKISPDLKTFKFSGEEAIYVRIKRPANSLAINSLGLKITKARVISGGLMQTAKVSREKDERVTLSFSKKVSGDVEFWFNFSGRSEDNLEGLYKSRYQLKGKDRYLLTTQFEPVSARRAFPCFDEPAFKATFSLSLVIDNGLEGISNMPIASEKKLKGGKKLIMFQKSPIMSTYLLYIGVGNYASLSGKYRNVKLRVMGHPGTGGMLKLAMSYAKTYLAHHERYYGIRYPLPKLDLIAVPDFPVGAMENWGAITFRETYLLGTEKTPLSYRKSIAEVIGHELAHQWFGDLVTMRWWNDLWLNESFANFMEKKSTDKLYPEWKIRETELGGSKNVAFSVDQSVYTHPISVNVETPAQIGSLFDRISYEKGGCLLGMIEDYVGEEAFRKGLNAYLRKNMYSNASKEDLWGAIDGTSKRGLNVRKIADYWTDTAGFPIIDIELDGGKAKLTQKRFFLSGDAKDNSVWPIPVHYMKGSKEGMLLMKGKNASLQLGKDELLMLNVDQHGLYRVSYPNALLKHIGKAIADKRINGIDAWGVQSDLFALVRSSRSKATRYLNFVDLYCMDTEFPANQSILSSLSWMYKMLDEKHSRRIKSLILRLSKSILRKVGREKKNDETPLDTMLRGMSLGALSLVGDAATVKWAQDSFWGFVNGKMSLDPDLKIIIFTTAARYGDKKTFDALQERYEKEQVPQDKMYFLVAMSAFRDRALFKRMLDYTLTKVRNQDKTTLVANVDAPENSRELWAWMKKNWKTLMRTYGPAVGVFYRFPAALRGAKDKETYHDMKRFFAVKSNNRDDIRREVNQTLEAIESNIRFINHNSHI